MSQTPAIPTTPAHVPIVDIWFDLSSKFDSSVFGGGGQVINLEPFNGDGLLDPLRFSSTPADGIELAVSAILEANPFGSEKNEYEAPLRAALVYGVGAGATGIRPALQLAFDAGQADKLMFIQVEAYADRSPLFRALIGGR